MRCKSLLASALALVLFMGTGPAARAAGEKPELTWKNGSKTGTVSLNLDHLDDSIYGVQLTLELNGSYPGCVFTQNSAGAYSPKCTVTVEQDKTEVTIYLTDKNRLNSTDAAESAMLGTLDLGTSAAVQNGVLPEKANIILLNHSLVKVESSTPISVKGTGQSSGGSTGGNISGSTSGNKPSTPDTSNTPADSPGSKPSDDTTGDTPTVTPPDDNNSGDAPAVTPPDDNNSGDTSDVTPPEEDIPVITLPDDPSSDTPDDTIPVVTPPDNTSNTPSGGTSANRPGGTSSRPNASGRPNTSSSSTASSKPDNTTGNNSSNSDNTNNIAAAPVQSEPDRPSVPDTGFVMLPFVDVQTKDWFYEAVQFVYGRGMMNGTGTAAFDPYATTTRGMIVTILHRLENSPAAGTAAFSDVPAGEYYAAPVAWASANGIVNGVSETSFQPNAPITREQMAAILYRYAQYKKADVSKRNALTQFSDTAKISSYAVDAVSWAVDAGLIAGMDGGVLEPAGNANRAQVATILMRLCRNVLEG